MLGSGVKPAIPSASGQCRLREDHRSLASFGFQPRIQRSARDSGIRPVGCLDTVRNPIRGSVFATRAADSIESQRIRCPSIASHGAIQSENLLTRRFGTDRRRRRFCLAPTDTGSSRWTTAEELVGLESVRLSIEIIPRPCKANRPPHRTRQPDIDS